MSTHNFKLHMKNTVTQINAFLTYDQLHKISWLLKLCFIVPITNVIKCVSLLGPSNFFLKKDNNLKLLSAVQCKFLFKSHLIVLILYNKKNILY